jgi:Ca2+-binding EF-hand superfamily protein
MMQDMMFVRLLKTVDTNKDAKITKEEMTAYQDTLFTAVDANKDGTLTRGEMLDYRQAKMEEFRKNNPPPEQAKADEQKPGDKMAERREHRGDRDRDDRRADDRHGPGRHDRDRQEARWDGPRGGPRGGMEGRGFFRMIDEDKDGKITKAEAVAASDKLFARLDTNKDGQITIDDLPNRPI